MKVNYTLAAGLFLLAIGGQVPAQPEPWSHPDGSIHYYCAIADSNGITWPAASDSAERLGGYLATFTSESENDYVFGLVIDKSYWHRRPGTNTWAGPWLGGRQRSGAPEPGSGWEWVTGEPMCYRSWSPYEPNNWGGDEDAMNFGESPYGWYPTWNDLNPLDTVVHGFVAELSAESTTIGLLQNDPGASVGYTMFEAEFSHRVSLIDNKGRDVHSWCSPYLPGRSNYLLEDGTLLHTGTLGNTEFPGRGAGGRVELLDWDSNLLWAYEYSNDLHCQHHDIEPLPNGNILMLAWEMKTKPEAIAAGRNPSKIWSNELWPDHIIEVNPTNDSIVWEWHTWDHLIQDYDSTLTNYGVVADHSELVDINYMKTAYADWMHSNAVDYNPQLDQVLINVRELGEVWVIDHSTTTEEARGHSGGRHGIGGDLLYRWGNPQAYRAGSYWDRKFFGQHDVRWVEPGLPGAGHMTVFNNGVGRPVYYSYATVDEFIPACDSTGRYPRPEPGTPFGPSGLCWTYAGTWPKCFYTDYMGSAHRLPNGNTLVCEADSGLFFEVTRDSQVVWRYVNPVIDHILSQGDTVPLANWARQNQTFRVTRYAPDYPGLLGRDLTPGIPVERYTAPSLGIAEATSPPARPRLSISPNPFRGSVTIILDHSTAGPLVRSSVSIFDASGRLVRSIPQSEICNLQSAMVWDGRDASGHLCPPGVYVCRFTAPGAAATAKILLAE
jgi:hypothetical protein